MNAIMNRADEAVRDVFRKMSKADESKFLGRYKDAVAGDELIVQFR
jgi:hypothetical protein